MKKLQHTCSKRRGGGTARLSAQKYFLGGGMVKNKPHSLKLILLLHTDIGLGKFT